MSIKSITRCGPREGKNPNQVQSLEKTCPSHPAQWSGQLSYHREFYIRYRWGKLIIGIGSHRKEAIQNALANAHGWNQVLGGEYDGEMTTDEMIAHLGQRLDFGELAGAK